MSRCNMDLMFLMLLSAPTSNFKNRYIYSINQGGELFRQGMKVTQSSTCSYSSSLVLRKSTDSKSVKCIEPAQGAYTNISIQGSPTKYSRAKLQASQNHTHTQHQQSIIYSQTQIHTVLHQKQTLYQLYLWLRDRASVLLSEGHWFDSNRPRAGTSNCSWCAGWHYQCMNVSMNYCMVFWTKAPAKCPKCKCSHIC